MGRKLDNPAFWTAAAERLAKAARASQSDSGPSGLRAEEVFARRALALAAQIEDQQDETQLALIAFSIGAQRVAIEARYIHAVIPPAQPTPVPGAADILSGVINFRGAILPVFRLERLLGADETAGNGCTIVLGEHRAEFAFFAGAAEEVSDVSAAALRVVPWRGGDALASLGVSDGALNVLDGRALLSDRRFYAGRQAAARS